MAVNDIVMGAAGGSAAATYIEDVFSTYLYTGNGSTQTITNGIDLSGKGGMTWIKNRTVAYNHSLYDTYRGATKRLMSNTTDPQDTVSNGLTSFGSTGFSIGADTDINANNNNIVSWTFREQPKFFDIVTYTGNGVNGRSIAHSLGSAPGCMIVKRIDSTSYGPVYHRSTGYTQGGLLYSTGAFSTSYGHWGGADPTSTAFTVSDSVMVNANGGTYVAYLFAHDAGGFGATGTDNVISCGSTGGGSSEITLGWEPQWLLYRSSNFTDDWHIIDNMRGAAVGSSTYNTWSNLNANTTAAETSVTGTAGNPNIRFTATGFILGSIAGTAIYIAIRRGPMKTPTTGTEVFAPTAYTGDGQSGNRVSTTVGCDAILHNGLNCGAGINWYNRLIGNGRYEVTYSDAAEQTDGPTYGLTNLWNSSFQFGSSAGATINNANTYSYYTFTRAPGFFDVVCYTGNSVARTVAHNLTVAPELIIIKNRTNPYGWYTFYDFSNTDYKRMFLNLTAGGASDTYADQYELSGKPTASVVPLGPYVNTNGTGSNYVAYLFASCPGVSKVGSYTGNGSSQTINCGFTAGARFFLVKATSTSGNWWVYDSSRGIISSNDPALALNSTPAEVTSADAVDADSSGIIVNQEATCSINASGVSYIFLAIA